MPAILKGWIDRTFANGFGYGTGGRYGNGALAGKKVMLMITTGATAEQLGPTASTALLKISCSRYITACSGMPARLRCHRLWSTAPTGYHRKGSLPFCRSWNSGWSASRTLLLSVSGSANRTMMKKKYCNLTLLQAKVALRCTCRINGTVPETRPDRLCRCHTPAA